MPEYANEQAAAAALAAANVGATPPPAAAPEPAAAPAPPASEPVTPPAPAEVTPPAESDQDAEGLKAMLATLPPEARAYLESREKAQQADYTKKTQALAEQRKATEDDLAFLDRIRTDPYAALEFHEELTAALTAAGMTPAQAAAVAAESVAAPTPPVDANLDPDDPVAAGLAKLKSEWETFQAAQSAAAEQAEIDALAGTLQRQEMAIRQNNPTYKDTDIDRIYALAFAPQYEGSLEKAQEAYEATRQEFISAFIEQKQVAERQTEPPAGAPAQVPRHFETLDAAHVAANEYLRNALAQR
jgi:hypothetical protein